jgi:hypothetical protein
MRVNFVDLIDPGLFYQIPQEHQNNLSILLHKINVLREASRIPYYIRDDMNRRRAGYRTMADHRALYDEINLKRRAAGQSQLRVPEHSWHLYGAACDVADPDGRLKMWILKNIPLVEEVGIWFEDFSFTDGFVHHQIYPPGSMQRFFKP